MFRSAMRNVSNNIKHISIFFTILFFVITFVLCYIFIGDVDKYNLDKYNLERYGHWFVSIAQDKFDESLNADIHFMYDLEQYETGERSPFKDGKLKEIYDDRFERYKDRYVSTTVYYTCIDHDYTVGYIDADAYDLFAIQLLEGHERTTNDEIIVSSTYAENQNKHVGDTLGIEINNQLNTYRIVGIFSNYNLGMPEILINEPIGKGVIYANMTCEMFDIESNSYNIRYVDRGVGMPMQLLFYSIDYEFNPHGVDGDAYNQKLINGMGEISMFMKVMFVVATLFTVLNYTNNKRRSKEFALYRGIGATTGQVMMMVVDETILIASLATVAAIVSFFIILFIYGITQRSLYGGIYHYHISMGKFIAYIIATNALIIGMQILPARSSVAGALSGAFDSGDEPIIKLRLDNIKRQTAYYLANRQLFVTKILSWTIIVFAVIALIFTTGYIQQDYVGKDGKIPIEKLAALQIKGITKEEANRLDRLIKLDDFNSHPYMNIGEEDFPVYMAQYQPDYILREGLLEGRLPENNHEVLITEDFMTYELITNDKNGNLDEYIRHVAEGDMEYLGFEWEGTVYYPVDVGVEVVYSQTGKAIDTITTSVAIHKRYNVGDTIQYTNPSTQETVEYKVVGVVPNIIRVKDYSDFDSSKVKQVQKVQLDGYKKVIGLSALFAVLPEEFEKQSKNQTVHYEVSSIFKTEQISEVENKILTEFGWTNKDYWLIGKESVGTHTNHFKLELDYIIIVVIVATFLFTFLNTNMMLDGIKDYSILRLLGITNGQLMIRQIWMAIIMTIRTMLIYGVYYVMLVVGFKKTISVIHFVQLSTALLGLYLFIYCIPLLYILKNHLLENYLYKEF